MLKRAISLCRAPPPGHPQGQRRVGPLARSFRPARWPGMRAHQGRPPGRAPDTHHASPQSRALRRARVVRVKLVGTVW